MTPETREKIRLSHLGKHASKETKEKMRKAHLGKRHTNKTKAKMRASATGKLQSILHREASREVRWDNATGPTYWLSFRDFILLAVYLYNLQYIRCSRKIREVLKEKELNRFDIVLFLNFCHGHTMIELSDKFHMDRWDVFLRLKHFRDCFPGCFQEQTSAPTLNNVFLRIIEWIDTNKLVEQF